MRSFALLRARESNYPGIFHEASQLIGDENTSKLVAQHGGTRLYIPGTLKPEHPLCQMLGQQVAQQLSDEFSGISIEIPRAVMQQIGQRNALIMSDRAAGMSQRRIALKYQLTERTIRNITNSTRAQAK